ncbi:MAG TPA: DinB family protein [Thermoanaerobaculia bacterium]|nr:DinB family protein [Thermoanaerobaculia bacterium]
MNNVEEAVRTWEMFRAGTVSELENIPDEQFEYRIGEGARSVRELALHILGSSLGFVNELTSGAPQFLRLRDPKVQAELMAQFGDVTTKAQLVELAKNTGASNAQRLRDHAATIEAGTMPMMNGEQSRVSGIWFAASHEMYHRGQLTTYARSIGVVPAMTQRIQAMTQQQK